MLPTTSVRLTGAGPIVTATAERRTSEATAKASHSLNRPFRRVFAPGRACPALEPVPAATDYLPSELRAASWSIVVAAASTLRMPASVEANGRVM